MKSRKRWLSFLTIFIAAVFSGYMTEMRVLQTSEEASLDDLAREMARVIRSLEPVMQPSAIDKNRVPVKGIDEIFQPVIARGLMNSLPDGSWQFEKKVTRGEGLFYFANLLETISREMVLFPVIIGIEPVFSDISAEHWLHEPLTRLAGLGSLSGFGTGRLAPDSSMSVKEIRSVGAAMIDYLGSNFILLIFDGKEGRVRLKGAMNHIGLEGWQYSFNQQNWYSVGKDGVILPDFSAASRCQVYFMNESYLMAGPIELTESMPSAGMIKLRRKYSEVMFKGKVALKSAEDDQPDAADSERERIKKRLAQILEISQKKKNLTMLTDAYSPSPSVSMRSDEKPGVQPAVDESPADCAAKAELPAKTSLVTTAVSTENTPPVFERQKKTSASENSSHEGLILDAITGKPLKGAMVIIAARQYGTDKDGKFIFEARPDSVLDLTAYSEGYEPITLRHRVGYRAGIMTLSLKPVLTVFSGRVMHSGSGRSLQDVVIRIGSNEVRSDKDGSFVLKGIKPGYHQLSCFAADFMEAHEIIHIGKNQNNDVEIKLRPIFNEHSATVSSSSDSPKTGGEDTVIEDYVINESSLATM
ncbi:MAG: carboxypeptidase-like regulatory domain-containing protein [Candidatus Riflebacteria bacterium]|nr:carboxypeptidase-like regulatory domain-containing protein [Candidatus Riflebacteria bacterium]